MSPLKLVAPAANETSAPTRSPPASGIRNIREMLAPCEACRTKAASDPFCDECTHRQRIAEAIPLTPLPEPSPPELCEGCQRKSIYFGSLCASCEAATCHAQVLALVRDHPA